MILSQLITYLDEHTQYQFLSGDAAQSLTLSQQNEHPEAVAGEMLKAIAEACQCSDVSCELKREDVVNALGPMRLKYMADDAPVEGFRLLEKSILAIDAAFNEEALKNR